MGILLVFGPLKNIEEYSISLNKFSEMNKRRSSSAQLLNYFPKEKQSFIKIDVRCFYNSAPRGKQCEEIQGHCIL